MKKMILFALTCIAISGNLFAKDKWENSCKAYFAEGESLTQNFVELIESEKSMIQMAVSKLTNRSIINALVSAKKKGVRVEVIVDKLSKRNTKPIEELSNAKIPVYVYSQKNEKDKTHMRNQFCLFTKNTNEEKLLWSGTFGFTYQSRQESRENVLLLSIEDVVKKYENEFETLKSSYCTLFDKVQHP
ncbi:MAG: hypothetical protein KAR79_05505 [Simkaniaceae bacterium]|nr:hypothetical protein [Simkaniaceae bacterium]